MGKKAIGKGKAEEGEGEERKKGLYTKKPSSKFTDIKVGDPFATKKKHKTNFGYVYTAGGIPCHIEHGSVVMRLNWEAPPSGIIITIFIYIYIYRT